MINYLKQLFFGDKPIHFTWSPENRIEVEKLLKAYDISFEIIRYKIVSGEQWDLYINNVGGFVPENTKLFIYKNWVYQLQESGV